MVVLIPHDTEQLKIIKLQKELISFLNNEEQIFVSNYPFWLPLDIELNNENLKSTSKLIKNISISKPQWDKENIICKFSYSYDDKNFSNKIDLLKCIKKSCQKIELPAGFSLSFPLELKIFRLGIVAESKETNSIAIDQSVWCKLA